MHKEFGDRLILLTEESVDKFKHSDIANLSTSMSVLDELDGSKNFKEGKENFSILMGLAERWRNGYEVTVGLIYKPLTREFYFATIDSDAIHVTKDDEREVLQTSRNTDLILGKSSVNVAIGRKTFPIDYPEEYMILTDMIADFRSDNADQVAANSKFSAGLEIMDVASGKVDVYLSAKAANWDYAAAALILEQAGGCSYVVRDRSHIITPKTWSLQLDKPGAYYPAFFTNGHIDASFFKRMKTYMPQGK